MARIKRNRTAAEKAAIVKSSIECGVNVAATMYGLSPSLVSLYRKKAGVKRDSKTEAYKAAYRDYMNGLGGISKIARKHGIGTAAFCTYCKNGGSHTAPNENAFWVSADAKVPDCIMIAGAMA